MWPFQKAPCCVDGRWHSLSLAQKEMTRKLKGPQKKANWTVFKNEKPGLMEVKPRRFTTCENLGKVYLMWSILYQLVLGSLSIKSCLKGRLTLGEWNVQSSCILVRLGGISANIFISVFSLVRYDTLTKYHLLLDVNGFDWCKCQVLGSCRAPCQSWAASESSLATGIMERRYTQDISWQTFPKPSAPFEFIYIYIHIT